jgi:hypothetical protein
MPSTPREREEVWAFLAPLAPRLSREHRVAILRMLTESVATCGICEESVRRCDPRCLQADELIHLSCSRRWSG